MANFMSDNVRPGAMFPVDATTVAKPEDFNMLTYQQPQVAPGVPTGGQLTPASTQPAVPFDAVPAMSGQQLVPPAAPSIPVISETSVQSKVQSPQALAEMKAATAQENAAIEAQARAAKEENTIQAMAFKKNADDIAQRQEELKKVQEEFAGKKVIDPMDKWGTGQRIGAAIAMGLGAFSAAFSGTRNFAADIIDENIKRDIALQERDIQRLGKNVDLNNNALAAAYARTGDMAQAKDVVHLAALAGISDQIGDRAVASKNKTTEANAMKLKAGLQTKAAERTASATESIVTSSRKTDSTGGRSASDVKNERDEENKVLEFENAKQSILRAFEEGQKQGIAGAVPSMLGGKKGEATSSLAQVSGAVIGKIPGIKSDSDFRNIVLPMLPSPTDPQKTVEFKRKNMENFLKSQAPAAWLKRNQEGNQTQKLKSQVGFQ